MILHICNLALFCKNHIFNLVCLRMTLHPVDFVIGNIFIGAFLDDCRRKQRFSHPSKVMTTFRCTIGEVFYGSIRSICIKYQSLEGSHTEMHEYYRKYGTQPILFSNYSRAMNDWFQVPNQSPPARTSKYTNLKFHLAADIICCI